MSSLVRTQQDPKIGATALWFAADGWVPNNQRLRTLLYRQVAHGGGSGVGLRGLFDRNGWPHGPRYGAHRRTSGFLVTSAVNGHTDIHGGSQRMSYAGLAWSTDRKRAEPEVVRRPFPGVR